jgi:imidazolonepropionase-like amidohydrolase
MRHMLACLLLVASSAFAQTTAIRFGKLMTGQGAPIADAVVVVKADRIVSVGSSVPAGATVIDLRRYTGIPGMIDVHTHMTFYWDRTPGTRPWTSWEP